MDKELKYVGKRIPSITAEPKSMGGVKYTSDVKLPHTLVGKCIFSDRPHANILSMDTSEAEKLPGVKAIVTYDNSPKEVFNPSMQRWIGRLPIDHEDMTIFSHKSHFNGDMIGAVAAVDEETAIKAISLIKIEYEDLPASLNAFEALKEGACPVHEDAPDNKSIDFGHLANTGDSEETLAESDLVVGIDEWIHTSRQHMNQLEPLTATAYMTPEGELEIWTAAQRPHAARKGIATIFGLPDSKVNVHCEYAGGFFGEANWNVIPPAVALALKTLQPVRVEFTREEFTTNIPCREVLYERGKIGFTRDGIITGGNEEVVFDNGAYHNRAGHIGIINMANFSGTYRMPSFDGHAIGAYSNRPPAGGSRGYGAPQGLILLELIIDKAAEQLGIDRLEIRRRNMKNKPGEVCGGIYPAETFGQEAILDIAADKIGYEEKKNRPKIEGNIARGIGMTTFFDSSGGQPMENMDRHCFFTLSEDGTIEITVNHPDGGMNLLGSMAAIVADTFGCKMEEVHFVHGQTKGTLYEFGLAANSGTYVMGNMMIKGAEMLKNELLDAVEYEYDIDKENLEVRDSAVWNTEDGECVGTLSEIATHILYHHDEPGKYCAVKVDYTPFGNPNAVGCCMADVSIDLDTGDLKIEKLVYVHDIGRAINPLVVEGQLQGGLAIGVGYALFEDQAMDPRDGHLQADNYNKYRMPSALDLPEMDITIYENPSVSGPYGAKGVGMSGVIGVPAAIDTAIYDALGIYITEMPFTPERILKAIKEAGIR